MTRLSSATLERLKTARGFIFDMDGTLVLADAGHNGATALPGAADTLKRLKEAGVPFVVFTNGTVKPPSVLAEVLQGAGLPVTADQVMTPSTVAARVIRRRRLQKVMMISSEIARAPLTDAGLTVTGSGERQAADAVFVAWKRDFTMCDIENACHAIWDGAAFLSGSLHPFYMTAQGRALGTSRAISAAITSLTGKRPQLTGKPSQLALREASRVLGVDIPGLVVVGDDAALEMAMATRGGALGVLVQTGVTGSVSSNALPDALRPDIHLPGLDGLTALLDQ